MADNSALEWTKLALTAVVGAIALSVGFIQYVATSSLSVRQPFLSRQMELCLAAAEHAARLATTKDEVQWQKSREDFWMLYYGPLAVVETVGERSMVETTMVIFGDELRKIEALPLSLPAKVLNTPALDIAHASRDLLTSKWKVGGISGLIAKWKVAGISGWFGY
jgi:hypothetical protein